MAAPDRLLAAGSKVVAELLAQRARDLARPAEADSSGCRDEIQVLRLHGAAGSWALSVKAVERVEPLRGWVPLLEMPPQVLGLTRVAGRRYLLADTEVLMAAAPPRLPDRPGHVVALREWAIALAVDRADAVLWLPRPPDGGRLLADGSLLVDPARLVAVVKGGGAP